MGSARWTMSCCADVTADKVACGMTPARGRLACVVCSAGRVLCSSVQLSQKMPVSQCSPRVFAAIVRRFRALTSQEEDECRI